MKTAAFQYTSWVTHMMREGHTENKSMNYPYIYKRVAEKITGKMA